MRGQGPSSQAISGVGGGSGNLMQNTLTSIVRLGPWSFVPGFPCSHLDYSQSLPLLNLCDNQFALSVDHHGHAQPWPRSHSFHT